MNPTMKKFSWINSKSDFKDSNCSLNEKHDSHLSFEEFDQKNPEKN
jgi:hypothetical protein